jgi:hypothetical protein
MIKKRINKKREIEKEIIVWTQIFILAIGIVAISYSIGSEIKFVSGKTPTTNIPAKNKKLTTADMKTEYNIKNVDGKSFIKGDPWTYYQDPNGNWYGSNNGGPILKLTTKQGEAVNTYLTDKGIDTSLAPPGTKEKIITTPDVTKKPVTTEGLWASKGGWKGFKGYLVDGFQWAIGIAGAIYFIAPMLGASEGLTNALTIGAFGGVLVGKTAAPYWGGYGTLAGVGVGVVLFYLFYKEETKKVVTFTCLPWQASAGGSKCEECNKQGILPCSEYQCKSLGQACELINKGTDDEKCVYINENDVKYPTIEPWDEALLEDYEYQIQNTGISPPDRGVIIDYSPSTSKCVKAFTPLSFGVTLNEPASCKIDTERKQDFEDMSFFMSGGLSLYNHSYTLSLPGAAALESEGITIQNNGEYELTVKCQDANGNYNTADFVFKFCVEQGPDTTPPLIVTTSIPSENPIAYEQTEVSIDVYINEPSQCKWSHVDQNYENMENDMVCSTSVFEMNAQMLYTCETTLTGLKNREENKFYFRCKDNSDNTNKESYEFSLIGTQPLVIDWVKPEDGSVIKDATESVQVTLEAQTSAGYNKGESGCEYSETGESEDYILFLGDENLDNYQHSQDLWLGEGDYTYYIRCRDLGGNSDVETINFRVESDASPPIVVRALHEDTYLRLVTNEPARCVYDTTYTNYPCDYLFEDGIEMKAVDNVNHYTEWNSEVTLYVKCEDSFGSQPSPDECSIIVRPFSNY